MYYFSSKASAVSCYESPHLTPASQSRPSGLVPLLLSSSGVFILIFWLLTLMPGRATQEWLDSGQPRSLVAAQAADPPPKPRVLPSRQAIVRVRGNFYHWDAHCPLLNLHTRHTHARVSYATRAQAEATHHAACFFCDRHED